MDGSWTYVYSDEPEFGQFLASGDLVLPAPSTLVVGRQRATAYYLDIAGEVIVYYIDADNPQILIEGDTYKDDDKIFISTDGDIYIVDWLQTDFFYNDGTYITDVPPLKYFVGLDLSKPGRQLVTLYDPYYGPSELYVFVYEGNPPPFGYEIIAPQYVAIDSDIPEATVNYYEDRYYSPDDPIVGTSTILLEDLDTSTAGWQQVSVYIETLDKHEILWIYVFADPQKVVSYAVMDHPSLIWDGTDQEVLAQISIRVTYADGTTLDTTGDAIASGHYTIDRVDGRIKIDILLNPQRSPGEDARYFNINEVMASDELVNIMFDFVYNSAGHSWRIDGIFNTTLFNLLTELRLPEYYGSDPVYGVDSLPQNGHITKVVIPAGYTEINEYAFQNFRALREVIFESATPPAIHGQAFSSSFPAVFVPDGAKDAYRAVLPYYLSDLIFYESERAEFMIIGDGKLIKYLGYDEDVVIPSGVKTVANTAFPSDDSIKSVFIPKTVTVIQNGAFWMSSSLTTVTFEEGSVLTSIRDAAFGYCDLTSIVLPDTLEEIGVNAFRANHNMVTIVFGASLQTVGDYALAELSDVSIIFRGETPPTFASAPFLYSTNITVYVPEGSLEAYIAAIGADHIASLGENFNIRTL